MRKKRVEGALLVGCAATTLGVSVCATPARAQTPPVDVRAENVEIDARTRELSLEGDVRVDSPPFHLRSDRLRVRRTNLGVEVNGPGRLAFCPCLGAPLAVQFEQATVAPPGDLLLKQPRLELFGLPVLWLPYFWLRSTARMGLLPPDVAYRGEDGLYLGGGVHVPWRSGDAENALDLRGGGYFTGGAVVDVRLVTPSSATHVRWDRLRDDGLIVEARGAAADGTDARTAIVAWDVDAVRGARGVRATTDLEAAARPFDRGAVEASWRDGGWTFASALASTSVRGAGALDLGAVGPSLAVRRADALGTVGAYDVLLEGGALGDGAVTASYARGAAGVLLAGRSGPFGESLALRGAGDVAAESVRDGASRRGADGVAQARARVALPLVRGFASVDEGDPWLHRVEPALAASMITAHGDDVLGAASGGGAAAVRGETGIAEAQIATALGRWGARVGAELTGSAALVAPVADAASARPAALWRAAASAPWLGLGGEGGHVWTGGSSGNAFAARARLGAIQALHVGIDVAERDGVDPVVARALTDAPLEPSSGFLAREGWTGGARVSVPWSRYFVTRAGADGDLTARELVAARASFELRNPCGCLVVRGTAAHRIGREGVDVWITIDLAPAAL